MNFHGKDIKIFTGSSNVNVAKGIAGSLGVPLGKSECTQFSDGEIAVSLQESVRGSDCFIVQSTCTPVNDNLMEMLIADLNNDGEINESDLYRYHSPAPTYITSG